MQRLTPNRHFARYADVLFHIILAISGRIESFVKLVTSDILIKLKSSSFNKLLDG